MRYSLIDTTSPPSATIARGLRKKIKAWGAYCGPYASPNFWHEGLARRYREVGVGILPIYVGQNFSTGTYSFEQGIRDGTNAVDIARSWGHKAFTHIALNIESDTVDMIPVGALRQYIKGWSHTVNLYNHYPICYCPIRFVPALEGLGIAGIWVAGSGPYWGTGVFRPYLRPGSIAGLDDRLWPKHRGWQYDGDATWNGINADFSVFNFPVLGMKNFKSPGPSPKQRKKGRSLPWHHLLKDFPLIDQITRDRPGDNAVNCGPTCTAMILRWSTGKHYDPEKLRELAGDPVEEGDYTGFEIDKYCFEHIEPAHTEFLEFNSPEHMKWELWRAISHRHHPVKMLFSFSGPGASDGHFRVIIGGWYDFRRKTRVWITANPDGGVIWEQTNQELFAWSKGIGLEVFVGRHGAEKRPVK